MITSEPAPLHRSGSSSFSTCVECRDSYTCLALLDLEKKSVVQPRGREKEMAKYHSQEARVNAN